MHPSSQVIVDDSPLPDDHEMKQVSVVMPVYNAAQYIDRTLCSVRYQTHRALEIVIVDDGSTDDSVDKIRTHMQQDDRIVLIQQANKGVAAARNAAIGRATSDYIAPIDADDLWAPEKIALQQAAADRHGPNIGLVFGCYNMINEADEILSHRNTVAYNRDLLTQMARNNIVGSGSAPLMLRQGVLDIGGYDSSLREKNAQGCEDYKLYFQLIERYPTVFIPQNLTGYRTYMKSMSADADQMMRSRSMVTTDIAQRYPELVPALRRGNVRAMRFSFSRALRSGRYSDAVNILSRMYEHDKSATFRETGAICGGAYDALKRNARRAVGLSLKKFEIGKPN